ncbi:hypothetical protein DC74_6024 [Streptomyces noursei]|nr:hypothetical protein DC74_6024 [Streptomyces noursei]
MGSRQDDRICFTSFDTVRVAEWPGRGRADWPGRKRPRRSFHVPLHRWEAMWRDGRDRPDSQDDRPREPPCVLRGRTERQLRSAMNDVWLWRKLTSGFAVVAAFDDEGVTDADGTVPVAVAVPGADHVKGRAGCRQLEILLEAAAQQDCPSGAGGERQIMRGLHEIRAAWPARCAAGIEWKACCPITAVTPTRRSPMSTMCSRRKIASPVLASMALAQTVRWWRSGSGWRGQPWLPRARRSYSLRRICRSIERQ